MEETMKLKKTNLTMLILAAAQIATWEAFAQGRGYELETECAVIDQDVAIVASALAVSAAIPPIEGDYLESLVINSLANAERAGPLLNEAEALRLQTAIERHGISFAEVGQTCELALGGVAPPAGVPKKYAPRTIIREPKPNHAGFDKRFVVRQDVLRKYQEALDRIFREIARDRNAFDREGRLNERYIRMLEDARMVYIELLKFVRSLYRMKDRGTIPIEEQW
jgi:hypothetical protein